MPPRCGAVRLRARHAVRLRNGDYPRLVGNPVDCHLRRRPSGCRRRFGQRPAPPVAPRQPPRADAVAAIPAAVPAAGQRPFRQRRVGDNRNVMRPAVGDNIPLGAPAPQIVQNLVGYNLVVPQRRPRRLQIRHGEVAHPDIPHQPVRHQPFHSAHRFRHRHRRVRPVHLVQVNLRHAQAAQAVFGGAQHGIVAQVAAQHFGSQENLLPHSGDGGAHGVLGAVHFGGVNQVGAQGDAPLQRRRPAAVPPGA